MKSDSTWDWVSVTLWQLQNQIQLANTPNKRRVAAGFQIGRLHSVAEALEARQVMSATGIEPSEAAAEALPLDTVCDNSIRLETNESPKSSHDEGRKSAKKKFKFNLSGQYSIPTPVGNVDLTVNQKRRKISGSADVADLNLTELLNLTSPLPFPLDVPPVNFSGTFKKGILNVTYRSQINLPVVGTPLFAITGTVRGRLSLGEGFVGTVTAGVNGNQLYSTDFTLPLSSLPNFSLPMGRSLRHLK